MLDVAIFAALGWERRAVTAALAALAPAGPGRWRGQLGDGASCLVVQMGVGAVRAAAAAADVPPARRFFVCGCAGALVDWLRPGDVVAAGRVVVADVAGRPRDSFRTDGESLAGWAGARGFRVHVGDVVSVPSVLHTADAKTAAGAAGALAVEMETGAVAAEAQARGIPLFALRVILDGVGEPIPVLDVLDEATGEVRPGRAAAALALRPRLWLAAGRLARQRRTAERSLRVVMAALLGAGLPAAAAAPAASVAVH